MYFKFNKVSRTKTITLVILELAILTLVILELAILSPFRLWRTKTENKRKIKEEEEQWERRRVSGNGREKPTDSLAHSPITY